MWFSSNLALTICIQDCNDTTVPVRVWIVDATMWCLSKWVALSALAQVGEGPEGALERPRAGMLY